MNAAGYDQESYQLPFHPVRRDVRQALQTRLPERAAARAYYQQSLTRAMATVAPSPDPHLGHFLLAAYLTDYRYLLTSGPDWRHQALPLWNSGPVWVIGHLLPLWWRFGGLGEQLRQFELTCDLPSLWRLQQPAYRALIREIEPPTRAAVDRLRAGLGIRQGWPVTVVPNLLGAYGYGHTANGPDRAYLMVTPQRRTADYVAYLRHEYLHPQVDPVVDAHRHRIASKVADLFPVIADSQAVRLNGYDERTIVEESLIRAIDGVFFDPASLARDSRHGFILVPAFAAGLRRFDPTTSSLDVLIRDLFTGLDVTVERRRWLRSNDETALRVEGGFRF